MTTRCLTRIEPIAAEWDALADRIGAPPWLRPGWIQAWRRAFGRGQLELLTTRREGRLAGVMPLERRWGTLRSTSNWHTPAYGLLAEDEATERELARVAFARGCRRVALSFVPSADRSLETCRAAAGAVGFRLIVRPLEHSPYVDVDGDWGDYAAGRRAKFMRELRRRRRRLCEQGSLVLEVADGTARLEAMLKEGFRVEAAGWKGRRGTAVVSQAATRRFYGDIARWAAPRQWLRLAFLRLDGRAIAFDYSLEAERVHYLLKTGYDPVYRAFSPGLLLREEMLARAFSSELARYEFLGDAAEWKLEWTDRARVLELVQGFAPSVPGMIDWAAFALGRPLVKRALGRIASTGRPSIGWRRA